MKKLLTFFAVFAAMLMLAGCGNEVDENKTPEEIAAEIKTMDADEIKEIVDEYVKAIEAVAADLKKEGEKLSKIPLTEQLGDEAKKIRANMDELNGSLNKLKANMEAYAAGLKK